MRIVFFIFCWLLCSLFYAQSHKADSLLLLLNKSTADTNKVKLLNDLSAELISNGNSKSAITHLNEAKELAQKLNYKRGIASAYNKIGYAYWLSGDYDASSENWFAALKIWEQLNDKAGISNANSSIGILYHGQGKYPEALEYFTRALKIAESIDDKKGMATAYNNIGNLYSKLGIAAEDKEEKRKKFEIAQENHRHGLRLMKEVGDKRGEANAFTNIGNVYFSIGNTMSSSAEANQWYEKDLTFQEISLKIKEEIDDKRGMGMCYSSMGIVYHMKDESKKAGDYFTKALGLYKSIGYRVGIKECYSYLGQLAEESGNYKEAFMYHKLFSNIKDSIINEKASNQLIEMEAVYQNEKKQKENEVLAQKNQLLFQQSKIQELKIKQSSYFISGLVVLALLVSGIAFLLIRQNRLNALHAKLEMEQKLLRSQMNPHFIFNAMVGIQNYIYKEEPEVAANYLSSVVYLMRSIIDNSTREFVLLDKEISTLHHYLTLQQVRFPDKFDFKIETDPELEIENIMMPPMMAQPVIENAIVHGLMNKQDGLGMIMVKFRMMNDHLILEIEDNGIGRDKAGELAKKDDSHLSIATNITYERLKILNRNSKKKSSMVITDLKNEKGESAGTRVTFSFPLSIT